MNALAANDIEAADWPGPVTTARRATAAPVMVTAWLPRTNMKARLEPLVPRGSGRA
jgi:hypothetical protein